MSAMRHPIHLVLRVRVGFLGMADQTAPFLVGSNPRCRLVAILEKLQMVTCLKGIIQFTLCMYTDHTLPLDTIMTVDV